MHDVPAPSDAATSFDQLVALCEPARRDLYFYVAQRNDWVSRDEAAAALDLRRGLVAHHLDRLADDGLVDVEYRRLTGRSGPGAGRPSKLYRRSGLELELTIPARNPALVAHLLAGAIGRVGERAEPVRRALHAAARDIGRAAARAMPTGRSKAARRRTLVDLLRRFGYEPRFDDGELSLANCPYQPLSRDDRDLVCSMNLALVEGAVEGVGLRDAVCSLRTPKLGGCCAHVRPWPHPEA